MHTIYECGAGCAGGWYTLPSNTILHASHVQSAALDKVAERSRSMAEEIDSLKYVSLKVTAMQTEPPVYRLEWLLTM